MYSLIIKNARIIDGSGNEPKEGLFDLAVQDDEIVNIAPKINSAAHQIIDIEEKILAPGFVDLQNHSDSYWQLFDNPSLDSLVTQGYTTAVIGQCGASLAPLLSKQGQLAMQKWHNLDGANFNWQTYGEFLEVLDQRRYGCNIAGLVGYATLRRGILGDEVRALEQPELNALKIILKDSLKSGAFGLSTGLSYAHEIIISQLELSELAKLVSGQDGIFSVHLRSEGGEIIESVEEVLEIARSCNLNLKLSHLKIRGASNWQQLPHLLEILDTAYHRGIKLHFDVYPYETIWQPLYSYLPRWAKEGGRQLMLKHFSDPSQKNKILAYLNSLDVKWPEVMVASTGSKLQFTGKTIGQIAKNLETSSESAVLHILEHSGAEVLVFEKNLEEDGVKKLLAHPLGFVATDGGGFNLSQKDKLVHPRCFGTAPKFLKMSVKENLLPLHEAVHKLSGGPAAKLGLKDRGQIKIGYKADLVVFDPKNIDDKATYENPYQYSSGIDYVFVNGRAQIFGGKLMGQTFGRVLRKKR